MSFNAELALQEKVVDKLKNSNNSLWGDKVFGGVLEAKPFASDERCAVSVLANSSRLSQDQYARYERWEVPLLVRVFCKAGSNASYILSSAVYFATGLLNRSGGAQNNTLPPGSTLNYFFYIVSVWLTSTTTGYSTIGRKRFMYSDLNFDCIVLETA